MATTEAPAVKTEDAAAWLQENKPVIVDVREPEEYGSGHLPGAVNIPQADLGVRVDEVPADKSVLVVDTAGGRAPRAASFLLSQGRANVMYLAGGSNAWKAAGNSLIS
jgi:rhodanese-related sulfurtransferase